MIVKSHSSNNALALSFDSNSGLAPTLSASSNCKLEAAEMISIAEKHGIAVKKNQHLVSKLKDLPLGSEIPRDCFYQVAKMLYQVEQRRNKLVR